DFERLWQDFHRYTELKHTHGSTAEALLAPGTATMTYDVEAWVEAGMPRDTQPFRLPQPRTFAFALAPDAAREPDGLLKVWTTSLKGLTKGVTRMRATAMIRHCRPADEAGAAAH